MTPEQFLSDLSHDFQKFQLIRHAYGLGAFPPASNETLRKMFGCDYRRQIDKLNSELWQMCYSRWLDYERYKIKESKKAEYLNDILKGPMTS